MRRKLRQKRWTFVWNHASFQIHQYVEPNAGVALLHVQGFDEQEETDRKNDSIAKKLQLPSFLQIDHPVGDGVSQLLVWFSASPHAA